MQDTQYTLGADKDEEGHRIVRIQLRPLKLQQLSFRCLITRKFYLLRGNWELASATDIEQKLLN